MLTTLLPPTAGNALVAGFDIRHHAADVRRLIGYVPLMISADGTLTGYENLLIFAKLYDIPRAERAARIREALAFMDLDDVAGKLVAALGGPHVRHVDVPISCRPLCPIEPPSVPRRRFGRDGTRRSCEGTCARSVVA